MPEPIRVDLDGALAGYHIQLDPNLLTFGLLEDIMSGQPKQMLDSFAVAIVGGKLPKGTDRNGLRQLTMDQTAALVGGIGGAFAVPKR